MRNARKMPASNSQAGWAMTELHRGRMNRAICGPLAGWMRFLGGFSSRGSGNLVDLLDSGQHSPVFGRHRARFIVSRTKLIAILFAVLTPLWIPLDALVFPTVVWQPLTLDRVTASLAFTVLALYCGRASTLKQAYTALAALFSIPAVFFLFSHAVLQGMSLNGTGAAMASGYAFLPFVLLAGLAIFPLTVLEAATFTLPLLAIAGLPMIERHASLMPLFNTIAMLWLLALVAAVASLSAVSQLEFLRTQSTDIAKIKRHEEALRESNERYALAVEGANEGLWDWDLTRDEAYYAPRIAAMIGIPNPDPKHTRVIYGRHVHPEDRPRRRQAFVDHLKGRTPSYNCEYRLRTADGSYRWVSDCGLGQRNERGRVYRMAGSLSDITERKSQEVELRLAKEQAERASQSKTAFLAHMSHELRTPLNAVIGFSDIIRQELMGPVGEPKYRGYAEDIYQSGTHLLEVINDILDVAKIEAGKENLHEEVIDVAQCAQASLHLVRELAVANGLTLECDLRKDLPPLRADERKFKQILINLLSNSIKFTPAGGRLAITAALTPSGAMQVAVSDTGIGIAADDLSKALSPFGQVDGPQSRKNQGTGLGLSLVQALAKLHGASFDLASESGKGTTVTLEFPAARVVHSLGRDTSRSKPEIGAQRPAR